MSDICCVVCTGPNDKKTRTGSNELLITNNCVTCNRMVLYTSTEYFEAHEEDRYPWNIRAMCTGGKDEYMINMRGCIYAYIIPSHEIYEHYSAVMTMLPMVPEIVPTLVTFVPRNGKLAQPSSESICPPYRVCLLYTSPSPRDQRGSRMPSSA